MNEKDLNDLPLINEENEKKSSDFGIFVLLINTTIGSGTLLIPYCFKSGLALVLIVSFLMALVALWSLWILVESGYVTKCYDYTSLFSKTFGKKYSWIMDLWITLVLFGTIIIYILWIGRLIKHIIPFKNNLFSNNIFINFLSTTFLIFPLTFFKSMKKLETWSGLAVFFIFWLLIFSIYWFIKGILIEGFQSNKIIYFNFGKQLISTFGIQSMAFDSHCNIFSALKHFNNPNKFRYRSLITFVIFSSFILYNLFGLFTYLHLFDKLGPGASLEYYPLNNWFTKLTILGVIFILILGAPMMVFPTRNSILGLFNIFKPNWLQWNLIGFFLVYLATIFASISNNIIFFFDLVGGLMTPGFIFTLPSIFYLKIVKNIKWYEYIFTILTIICSIIATFTCTYQVLNQ